MVIVRRVHNDDNSVLYAFLTDREHYRLKLFLRYPLLCLVYYKGCNAVNRFQLCRLVSRACLDTPKHHCTTAAEVLYICFSVCVPFRVSIKLHLLHKLGDNRHRSRYHSVTSIEYLMNYSLCRSWMFYLKQQTLNESGNIETLSTSTTTSNKNDELILIVVQRSIYLLWGYSIHLCCRSSTYLYRHHFRSRAHLHRLASSPSCAM